MSLDDKLIRWRNATEQDPSPELLARLETLVDAPPSKPVATASTVIKVLLATLVVGVALVAAVVSTLPSSKLEISFAVPPVADAGTFAPCPSRGEGMAVAEPAMVSPRGWPRRSDEVRRARRQLQERPLTCEGQLTPLDTLLFLEHNTREERLQFGARKAWLCQLHPWEHSVRLPTVEFDGNEPLPADPTFESRGRCDDSAWCHLETCDRSTESCLRTLAKHPLGTCTGRDARLALIEELCVRHLRAASPDPATVAELNTLGRELHETTVPWCLTPEALREAQWLRAHGATQGTFQRR